MKDQLVPTDKERGRWKMLTIKKLSDEENITCQWYKKNDDCWQKAIWFVEGSFYCNKHKEAVLRLLGVK